MDRTTHETATRAKSCAFDFESFGDFVARDRAQAKTPKGSSHSASSDAAETVTRLVEENRGTVERCSTGQFDSSNSKRKRVTAKQYEQATKFEVGSEIDEGGLSAIEFRIYGHLVRRADKNRESFPSITNMCDVTGCDRKSVIKALRELERRRFIYCRKRHHASTHYVLRSVEDWCNITVE
jgi:hypothetical protein